MTKGRHIAEGRTAEVFAWGGDQILKLFRPGFKSDRAESEAVRVRAVHAAGLTSPAVIGVVEVDGPPRHSLRAQIRGNHAERDAGHLRQINRVRPLVGRIAR